jgi:hypothetical protein
MKYVLTALAMSLVLAGGSSAGSVGAPTQRTLVNSPTEIFDFAQDRGSIAWESLRKVHIRALTSGRTVAIRKSPSSGGLVLGGTRALWHGYVDRSSNVWAEIKMRTASLSDPTKRPIPCCAWKHEYDSSGPYLRAGKDGVLVYYSARDRDDESGGDTVTERAFRRVMPDGSTRKLFDLKKYRYVRLSALDLDRGRLAFVHTRGSDEFPPIRKHVEIRRLNGSAIASFVLPEGMGDLWDFALDGPTVVILNELPSGSRSIKLFDASSGKPRGGFRLRGREPTMAAGGGWVVYSEGRVLRAFRIADSARFSLRTQARPGGLSIAGRRVAWMENSRIRAFALP